MPQYENEEHQTIWLQPWCDRCEGTGESRLWCQDDVWGACEECGRKASKYVLKTEQGKL